MASFNNLKNSIRAAIKENGNNEITGQLLQDILIAMVNTLGLGYEYIGVATLTTNPGTPDTNVFYIAATAGTYANFGGLALSEGEVAILKYNGTWSKDSTGIASLEKVTNIETEIANIVEALDLKADKNGSLDEIFNAKSIKLPTTGTGSGVSQIVGAVSPMPGIYRLPDSAAGGRNYTLATTEMVDEKADRDTDAVEGNLAEFDANGNPVDSGIPSTKIGEIEDKVTELGNSAGISEGIADSISAGTPQEIVFRKSGGDGVNYIKRFKGRTLAWNQYATVKHITESTYFDNFFSVVVGHKYLYSFYLTRGTGVVFVGVPSGIELRTDYTLVNGKNVGIVTGVSGGRYYFNYSYGNGEVFDNVELIDLTLLYGTEIDGLTDEQILEKYEADFGTGYHEYNAGTLISNDASALETVGFNQWDEEKEEGLYDSTTGAKEAGNQFYRSKNYIPVFPNTDYYYKSSTSNTRVLFYDANKNYIGSDNTIYNRVFTTPNSCYYLTFFYLKAEGNICINLSDASKNGTYEPYWKRNISLNLSTLKDKDGNLVFPYGGMNGVGTAFDSVKPDADGFIRYANRVFARVNMGSLTWLLNSESNPHIFKAYVGDMKRTSVRQTPMVCDIYKALINGGSLDFDSDNKSVYGNDKSVYVYDTSYDGSTPEGLAAFAAAMSVVYLIYELETPAVVELAEPIPNAILVDELGTEKAIFPEHEDGSPSAPLCTDSNYSISVKNLVSKLANI